MIAIDQQVFIKLNELCEEGIRPSGDVLPLGQQMGTVLADPDILALRHCDSLIEPIMRGEPLKVVLENFLDWCSSSSLPFCKYLHNYVFSEFGAFMLFQ